MQNENLSIQVKQMQRDFFGERYVGANLSAISLNHQHGMHLNSWLKEGEGILVLAGVPGCGKTYLCSALVAWMFGKVRDIYAMDERSFFQRLRGSMEMKGDYQEAVDYQCDHEFFIFDDLGSTGEGATGWRQEVLFSMINLRYESTAPTVITTNLTRENVSRRIGERGYSRLYSKENTIIEMFNYPDLRNPLNFREDVPKPHLSEQG